MEKTIPHVINESLTCAPLGMDARAQQPHCRRDLVQGSTDVSRVKVSTLP